MNINVITMKNLINLKGVVALDKEQLKGINGGSQAAGCGECYYLGHKCNPGVWTSGGACQPC